jgi:hypothetical protein
MGEAAKTPYHLQPEVQQKQRERYLALTPEQREARRIRQTEQQRIRRARIKAGLPTSRKADGSPVDASKPVNGPVTSNKPGNHAKSTPARSGKPAEPGLKAQDLASYEDLSTHKAKALQRVWRSQVSEYLLEAITRPDSPFTGAGLRASKMICLWWNLSEKLDRIVEADSDKPDSQQEMTLAVMLECLRRLTGEGKTAAAPTLPGIASSFESQGIRPKYPGS